MMYRKFLKRFLDVLLAFVVLVVLAPVLLCIAVAIRLDSEGPALFAQRRLGKDGKEFLMYKFRTMVLNAESEGVYSDNHDTRVTRIGRFLRRTSLDELPQCWNVIQGDMSIVGFRPPLTYHPWPWEAYTEAQKRMFALRPGITGWAQVNGRRTMPWQKRIELNVWYVEHVSFWLDCRILLRTIIQVLANVDNENVGASVSGKTGGE